MDGASTRFDSGGPAGPTRVGTIDESAAYLAGWLKVLKGDKKLLIGAAGQAQRAADHILGVSYQSDCDDS